MIESSSKQFVAQTNLFIVGVIPRPSGGSAFSDEKQILRWCSASHSGDRADKTCFASERIHLNELPRAILA
jgi:hypothetical protein